MASFKQIIVAAIHKISEENPALNVEGQMSFEEARNDFIRKLIAELFPECPDVTPSSASVTIPTLPTPEPEKKKRGRKPKTDGVVNLKKLLKTTHEKVITKVEKELKIECNREKILEYVNGMSAEDFGAKNFEQHVRDCFAPEEKEEEEEKPQEPEKVAMDLVIVEFDGKEYYVNEESKRVYVPKGEPDEDGMYPGWEPVGYVGMAAFKEMKLDV